MVLALLVARSSGTIRSTSLANPNKFLIVSAPVNGSVFYTKIPEGGIRGVTEVKVLISELVNPQGLAIDVGRSRLIVADPPQKKIVAYKLSASNGGADLTATSPTTIVEDTEARWIAVDGQGAVYFTQEATNTLSRVALGETSATTVFDGATVASLNAPGGLALDSFSLYWVNKALGTKVGSVVRGPKPGASNQTQLRQLTSARKPEALAKNSDKSYGICMAMSNVFYTQPEAKIYGMQPNNPGAEPTVITDRLNNPRGCAFDGDGTVYVADRGANAVYSFAGNMQTLSYAEVTKAADVPDAFGVVVFSGAQRSAMAGFLVALVVFLQL